MSFMKRTFNRMSKMFDDFDKDMDDMFKEVDLGPLPDGTSEVVTEETETKPDGTVIHRKTTRRTVTTKPSSSKAERTDTHSFVPRRTNNFVGYHSETCEHCGKDPRNVIHR